VVFIGHIISCYTYSTIIGRNICRRIINQLDAGIIQVVGVYTLMK
jgi:hypothetical protein